MLKSVYIIEFKIGKNKWEMVKYSIHTMKKNAVAHAKRIHGYETRIVTYDRRK